MCLDILGSFNIKKYEGWQIFWEKEGKLYPIFYPYEYSRNSRNKRKFVPIKKWEKDKNDFLLETNAILRNTKTGELIPPQNYETGFHIFPIKKEVEKYLQHLKKSPNTLNEDTQCICIRKVYFTNVVAKGYMDLEPLKQDGPFLRVVVAKERYVL